MQSFAEFDNFSGLKRVCVWCVCGVAGGGAITTTQKIINLTFPPSRCTCGGASILDVVVTSGGVCEFSPKK